MAITRKPKTSPPSPAIDSAAADAFISGAPDSAGSTPKVRGVKKGNRQQITLTIAPALLVQVDELAGRLGQSRAAVINMAISQAVVHGLTIDGLHKAA